MTTEEQFKEELGCILASCLLRDLPVTIWLANISHKWLARALAQHTCTQTQSKAPTWVTADLDVLLNQF